MADSWSAGTVALEVLKAALALPVAGATLAATWLIGNRQSHRWTVRQKHRELDLMASRKLDELYGELLAVGRLWVVTPFHVDRGDA